jgi:hypothetical protein
MSIAASSRSATTSPTTSSTPGGAIDFADVEGFLLELASRYELQEVRFDPRFLERSMEVLAGRLPSSTVAPVVSLLGAGSGLTTIGGVDVGAGVSVSIRGVTITTGFNHETGVTNAGTLTLKSSVVRDNINSEVGGIFNKGTGTLTLQDSTVTQNFAYLGSGGGIFNAGTLTVQNST